MNHTFFTIVVLLGCLLGAPAFSQTGKDTTALGLPGDNLDLYAVLDLFQKSKTIEDFEETLNLQKTGINNLDLNLDGKVDFIKVITKKDGDNFTFVLQVDVNDKEKQDVAVILLSKDKNKKVTLQIVGDPALYGKNYVIEPKTKPAPSVTPNPAYTGTEPVPAAAPASTTVVVIESAPVVQYVYSPVYVPYVPPYYYGFYPPYFAAFTVMAVGIYRHNNYYYHGAYYGGHSTTVVVHNTNNYNNYNNSRNTSNTVNHNNANGNYNNGNRQNAGSGNRPSTGDVNRGSQGGGNRQSASPSSRPSSSPSNRGGYSGGGGGRGGSGYSGGGGRGGGGRR